MFNYAAFRSFCRKNVWVEAGMEEGKEGGPYRNFCRYSGSLMSELSPSFFRIR